ncbi:hypothetical protein G7054_g6313 [Neopestalotiopsis clavispora]|nr:hypothetical protein G7054_g6313 [Neopestalotiopsis clavispora]
MAKFNLNNRRHLRLSWWLFLVLHVAPVLSGNEMIGWENHRIWEYQVWTTRQMDNFFPSWNGLLRGILTNTSHEINADCSRVLAAERARATWRPYGTVECLLNAFPESRKAEMAASSVLLGLLPVILSQLGPSSIDQSLLSLRRPLLALLLAIGSPAVNGLQNAHYNEGLRQRLHTGIGVAPVPKRLTAYTILTTIAEYTVVLATVANVTILGYQLSVWAITVFALGFIGLPAIWISLAIAIHIVRVMALYSKVHIDAKGSPLRFRQALRPDRSERQITLRMRDSKKVGDVLVWVLYVATILHTLLGVVSLSGLVFISMKDSLIISIRFLANAIVCKCIFAFESAGIEKNITLEDEAKV